MPRLSILLAAIVLTGCTIQKIDQSPEKQRVANALHKYIMETRASYPREPGRKVMYGCIHWPESGPPVVETTSYYYTEVHQHYSASVMREMRHSAEGVCDSTRTKHNLDCTCQRIDENGQNFIEVPG